MRSYGAFIGFIGFTIGASVVGLLARSSRVFDIFFRFGKRQPSEIGRRVLGVVVYLYVGHYSGMSLVEEFMFFSPWLLESPGRDTSFLDPASYG